MDFNRTDVSAVSEWWWTVDKFLFAAVMVLMFTGFILTLAAGPSVALRFDKPLSSVLVRQLIFIGPALCLLIGISLLDSRNIRRLALVVFAASIALMIFSILFEQPRNGATRWLWIGPISLQPSEFAKPAFVILSAWFFVQGTKRADQPGHLMAIVLFSLFAALLLLQPDLGQTILVTLVWCAMFFMAGMAWFWLVGFGVVSIFGLIGAYVAMPHVTERVNTFLYPGSGDRYQVDKSLEAILSGGWLGRGPGEGIVILKLPDAHTDFVFAVVAEEFGIIACLILVMIFAFIVLRGLKWAANESDPFVRLATAGLSVLIGVQAGIHMAVNLGLAPAKGMTLPLISYGGSSLMSVAISIGMILALTRRRPGTSIQFSSGQFGVEA